MADETEDQPAQRATTQLVYRTVDDLGKRMDAHFDGVKQRLDRIEPVEGRVDGHDRILANHEVRLLTVEERARSDSARSALVTSERTMWQKVQRPTLILGALALVAAVVIPIVT